MGNPPLSARSFLKTGFPNSLALCLLLVLGLAWGKAFSQIPNAPNPPRLVNDLAQVMSSGEVDALEEKLRRYNDSTSTQIAIVTVQSLGGYDVQQFAHELAEKWGIGQKGKNNGILILAAIEDHKMTIQTGYGVEDRVPDAYAKRIISNQMRPAFKQSEFYAGFDQAVDQLFAMLTGAYKGDPNEGTDSRSTGPPIWVFFLVIIVIWIIVKAIGRGGGGTTIGGNRNRGGGWFLPVVLGSGGGGGGSSWSGGSSGGGSSFGGFGGGSFGGGGASGSW